MITKFILNSRASRWDIERLSRLLKGIHYLKRGLQSALFFVVFIVSIQLAYPSHMARPLMWSNGHYMGFWSDKRLDHYLQKNSNQPYLLEMFGRIYQFKPSDLGMNVDVNSNVSGAFKYNLKQRLVPFTLISPKEWSPNRSIRPEKLNNFLKNFAVVYAQEPVIASVQKTNGVYSAVLPDKVGYVVNTEALKKLILTTSYGSNIAVPLTEVAPKITQKMLKDAIKVWYDETASPMDIQFGKKTVTVSTDILRQWAVISVNQQKDAVSLTYDAASIKSWLAGYSSLVYVDPKDSINYLRDQEVTNVVTGTNGQALDIDTSTDNIITALLGHSRTASASVGTVTFKKSQINSFSPSSYGIQLLINNWAAQRKGMTAAVSFQEIGGAGRVASLNPDQSFFSASIYKLFVAYYIYNLIETGKLDLNSPIPSLGQTVDSCIELMIVISNNSCPQQFGRQFGWDNESSFVKAHGFNSTSFSKSTTTTGDVAKFLDQLYSGNLLNSANRASLLDKMGRQVFRSAIPAGSPGSQVYDKVGFLGRSWHDAAIVRGNKADYMLVVFTENGGAPAIKDLASQIQETINQ